MHGVPTYYQGQSVHSESLLTGICRRIQENDKIPPHIHNLDQFPPKDIVVGQFLQQLHHLQGDLEEESGLYLKYYHN